jgi:DNA invertase Pin-like site-specific DNA recombinase
LRWWITYSGRLSGWAIAGFGHHRTAPASLGFRYPPDVILVAVRWYLRYALSYRDVEELLGERGIIVDRSCLVHTLRAHGQRTASQPGRGSGWVGQSAAIYCRISKARDEDQTGVDRQERLCREVAERLGLVIAPDGVFVDNNRSAWQRNRTRPGWMALLEAIRAGRVWHVIVYHPDRLMRQPRDLEELLTLSEERDITLHGQANRRDLSDPDDRFFLRTEVAHACRSSDDTSRRLRMRWRIGPGRGVRIPRGRARMDTPQTR